MDQANRAIERDLLAEQPQLLARFPEAALKALALRRLSVGKAPIGEIRRGCDAEHSLNPLRPEQRDVEREPAAHRRADDDQRAFSQAIERSQRLLEPPGERPILEAPGTRSGPRIIEAQQSNSSPLGEGI